MLEDLLFFVGVPALLGLGSYLFYLFSRSGLTAPVEVVEKEHPSFFQKTTTLFYKHHIGSFAAHTSALRELVSLLPQGSCTVQIFYDDESSVPQHKLQSAIGCIFGEAGSDFYTQNFAVQLKRFGFERLVIKPIGRTLEAVVPTNDSVFARRNLGGRVRPAVSGAFDHLTSKPDTKIVVQIVDTETQKATVLVPLDSAEEFIDAQYLSAADLENKLARQCFDSDQESSESEPEGSGDEEEHEDE